MREYITEYMVDHDDLGVRAMLGLNRKAARLPAEQGLMNMAKHYVAKLKKKSVRALLVEWTQRNHLDAWIADFIVDWSKTGEPPALADASARVAGDFRFGADCEPIVFLFAATYCDPDEPVEEFKRKCAQVFPPETWIRKGFPERDAKRFKAFVDGATDFDIAKTELDAEGWQTRAATKREYNAQVKSRANSILHSRNRWEEYVTGLLDSVSRSSA